MCGEKNKWQISAHWCTFHILDTNWTHIKIKCTRPWDFRLFESILWLNFFQAVTVMFIRWLETTCGMKPPKGSFWLGPILIASCLFGGMDQSHYGLPCRSLERKFSCITGLVRTIILNMLLAVWMYRLSSQSAMTKWLVVSHPFITVIKNSFLHRSYNLLHWFMLFLQAITVTMALPLF